MSRRQILGIVVAAIAIVFGAAAALGAGDVIEVPGWANVKGVDIPIVGNTELMDCKLSQVDGLPLTEIRLVDGDETTYPDFVHVWHNGDLVDPVLIDRPEVSRFVVPGEKGGEQFYAISIIPERDDRRFCGSITLR